MAGQPRTRDLGLLLEEIAFGDQHQVVRGGERRDRLFDAVEEFDRGFEHLAGQFDDPAYLVAANAPFGQFDRRFDHREREAFDAVAVMFEVTDFRLVHPALYPVAVVIMRQDVEDLTLRATIDRLVVPQRVAGVEVDNVEHKLPLALELRDHLLDHFQLFVNGEFRRSQTGRDYERHGMRPDRVAAADRVEPLVRLRLDVDLRPVDSHRLGESRLHLRDVRRHFRAFGQDRRVNVGDLEPAFFEQTADVAQEDEAVGACPSRILVGEMRADVAERGRAEQRVGDCVRQAVAVGMAEQAALVRDFEPAEDQLSAFDQTLDVISDTYAKLAHKRSGTYLAVDSID